MMQSAFHFQMNEGSTQYVFFYKSQGLDLHNTFVEAWQLGNFSQKKNGQQMLWLFCYWVLKVLIWM